MVVDVDGWLVVVPVPTPTEVLANSKRNSASEQQGYDDGPEWLVSQTEPPQVG